MSRVHPPQVHQQFEAFEALAGSLPHEPSTERGISGILIPDAATSWIHPCTNEELIGGTTSSAGKPRFAENTTTDSEVS